VGLLAGTDTCTAHGGDYNDGPSGSELGTCTISCVEGGGGGGGGGTTTTTTAYPDGGGLL
jgi:hypothetical protein